MPDRLTPKTIEAVVRSAARLLRGNYVYPQVAEEMATRIEAKLEARGYAGLADADRLGAALTEDLRQVSKDLHLIVYHDPAEAAQLAACDEVPETHWWTQAEVDNFGFQRVEILEGNVGYVEVRCFAPASLGGETAVAVMGFLAQSEALLFDLRRCSGGDQYMVQLVESYLFEGAPVHLITLYERPTDRERQIWTLSHVPGRRMPDVPAYVLTSGRTFSGGEDFAYTLQQHGRAIVVGETTGGGAHGIDCRAVHAGFVMRLPTERPIHPVTGDNWEGTGVVPQIRVPEADALRAAHVHALETLIAESEEEGQARWLRWTLQRVQARYAALTVDEATLARYAGAYEGWIVTLREGALSMSSAGGHENWVLLPMAEDLFAVDGTYNARFVVDEGGAVTGFLFLCRDDERAIMVRRVGT